MKIEIEPEVLANLLGIEIGRKFTISERDESGYFDSEYMLDKSGQFIELIPLSIVTTDYHTMQIINALIKQKED